MDFVSIFPRLFHNINSEKVRPPPVSLKNEIAHWKLISDVK